MAAAHGMSLSIEQRVLDDHVRIACAGIYSVAAFRDAFAQAFAIAAAAGRHAVLLDMRGVTGGPPTMSERYELAVAATEMQASRKPRIRMAVLGHEPMVHPERFGEIVATNRGGDGRVFTDETLALQWLLGSSGKVPAQPPPDALD
jgi:hypothetical protein